MTATEARKILLDWMRGSTTAEYPLIWVSELPKEDETDFIFEAATFAQGETPDEEASPVAVNKHTGGVELRVCLC